RDFHVTGVQTCALPIYNNLGSVSATITQSGNENYAVQTQKVYQSSAFIAQTGNRNVARQSQLAHSVLSIVQDGSDNTADQIKEAGWGNEVKADQQGNRNRSFQNAASWGGDASILQVGNDNNARQEQSGSLNGAVIQQEGNDNLARQEQYGAGRGLYPAKNNDALI